MSKISKIQHLTNMLKQSSIVFKSLASDSANIGLIVLPIKPMVDELVPEGHTLYNLLYVGCNNEGVWAITYQATTRLIDESNPRRNSANTKILLDGAAEVYKANLAYIDANNTVPYEWSVDMDLTGMIMPSLPNEIKMGAVVGVASFTADTKAVYDLINNIDATPVVEFDEVSQEAFDALNTIQ